MAHDAHQQVFPFLAEDPLYRREVREERIVRDVTNALQARLRKEADSVLREVVAEKLEAAVTEAVSSAVNRTFNGIEARLDDLTEFMKLLIHVRFPEDDPADWWKNSSDEH
jgi:hypothetical protein